MKGIISCFLLFLFLWLCGCTRNGFQENTNVFRYNESNGISGLDPAFARTQSLIWPVNQLFNGLVQMNDELTIVPGIAHSWEVSQNGLLYTFHLRRDVRFHEHKSFQNPDDRKVNAEDFVYSFNRILKPGLRSPGRWVFSKVKNEGFIAKNDSTLEIYLSEAFAPFLGILTMPYCSVVPQEVLEDNENDFSRNPCGTGPFKFKMWREEEKLVLVKNEDYFEMDENGSVLPYLDAVSISFIKDKQSEFMEFLLGNIDFLSGAHPSYKDELITRSGSLNPKYSHKYKIITQDYLNTEYLAFLVDTSLEEVRNHPCSDPFVRKAINYGFDRVKMMKYLRNNVGKPANYGFIPPGMKNYNVSSVKGYEYKPDTSAYFLEKAGYPGGEGLNDIVLTTTSDYVDLCEFIQYELQKIGISLKIEISTGVAFRNKVLNSNLNFFRASWIADYPDPESYFSLFYSGNFSPSGPNYTHFSNPEYDRLYELSNQETDPSARQEMFQSMDQMIIDHSAVVPLFYDQVLRFVPLEIQGFQSNPMNLLKLKYVRKQK